MVAAAEYRRLRPEIYGLVEAGRWSQAMVLLLDNVTLLEG